MSRGLHGSLSDSARPIRPGPHTPRLRAYGLSITRALWKLGVSTPRACDGQRLRNHAPLRASLPRSTSQHCDGSARPRPPPQGGSPSSSQDPPCVVASVPCARRPAVAVLGSGPAATTPPTCRLVWRLRRRHQTAGKTRARSDDQPNENDLRKHPLPEESGLRKPHPASAPTTLPPLAAVFERHPRRRMARHEAGS